MISVQLTFDSPEEAKAFFSGAHPAQPIPWEKTLTQEEVPKDKRQPLEHITPGQKAEIIELSNEGHNCSEIKKILGINNGRQIQGIITSSKYPFYNVAPKATESPKVEGNPEKAQSIQASTEKPMSWSRRPKEPQKKALTDKQIDNLILDLAEGGAMDYEISRLLEQQHAIFLTVAEIGTKIKGFKKEGLL
jgi:hypothetical protein